MNQYLKEVVISHQLAIVEMIESDVAKISFPFISTEYSINEYNPTNKHNHLFAYINPVVSLSNAKRFLFTLKPLLKNNKFLIILTEEHEWLKPNVKYAPTVQQVSLFDTLFNEKWIIVFKELLMSWEENEDELLLLLIKQFTDYCINNSNTEYVTYYNIYLSECLDLIHKMPQYKMVHITAFLSKLHNLIHNYND
jgi:hypothetical protein